MSESKLSDPLGRPLSPASNRLESWKEIAAYLKRGVTTVQRWERREGLPVNRHQHAKLGSVYAYKSEIDTWWSARRLQLDAEEPIKDEGDVPRTEAPPNVAPPAHNHSLIRYGPPLAGGVILAAVLLVGLNAGGLRDRLLAHTSAHQQIHSIAVLPLEDLSRDTGQEYLADGMTDELITELSRIKALKVISRTSAMQYKNVRKPLPEIARELNIDGVVEGTVLREGDKVRISVQLIHAPSDTHLWAQDYTRDARAALALQSEVARDIAREIRIVVTPEEATRLEHTREVDPEAHALFLKGLYYQNQGATSKEALERSLETNRKAIEKDPNYASAYAGMATTYLLLSGAGYMPMRVAAPQAKVVAQKALELDPNLGQAYSARGMAKFYGDWDWTGAEEDLRHAVRESPGSAVVHDNYAFFLSSLGRREEAYAQNKRAQELDPLSALINVHAAFYRYHSREYDEAVEECRRVLTLDPDDLFAKWMLGVLYTQKGMYDEAISEFLSRKVPTADTNWALGYAYGRAGKNQEARRILNYLLEKRKNEYIWPTIIAVVYSGMGDKDHAFEWLKTAYEEHEFWLIHLKVDPVFDPLRSDPRFAELVKRMSFPQ